MKTIYNTYVVMQDQEQCDRMKSLCVENGLPIWNFSCAFTTEDKTDVFAYINNNFFVFPKRCNVKNLKAHSQVTEQEFIELLKTTK